MQKTHPLLKPIELSSLNYFASAWCAVENMLLAATAEGLGTVFHIPVGDEADRIKEIVGVPEGYEPTCLLTMGYPKENAFLPKQKEINPEDRIHKNACNQSGSIIHYPLKYNKSATTRSFINDTLVTLCLIIYLHIKLRI